MLTIRFATTRREVERRAAMEELQPFSAPAHCGTTWLIPELSG